MLRRLLVSFAVLVLLGLATPVRAEKAKTFVFTPSQGAGPFPVAVWLHGYRGYSPDGYMRDVPREVMQKHADVLGAVIIGFPATADLGDDTQQWSEEPVADHAYIQQKLQELSKTVKLDLKHVGLFSFSQGAKVAADLASRYPECYCGAIIMSPGGLTRPNPSAEDKPEHRKQVFFCFCGAGEAEGNIKLTKGYAAYLTAIGAHVTLKLYDNQTAHQKPADFAEKFPQWMGAVLKANVQQ